MAVYSFASNAIEEAALSAHRLVVNAERAAQTPPLPPFDSNDEYVADTVQRTLVGPLVQRFIETRLQEVANRYRAATNQQRQAVDTALGL